MKYKILVVDDDKELVKMLCRYFNMKQYETITATDGMEALNKIKMKPDIILLDINMPRMDGNIWRRTANGITVLLLYA